MPADPIHPLRGIACMLAAVAAFAVMDAMLKLLSAHYPPMQVAALRGLASLPPIMLWIAVAGAARSLLRVRWGLHLLRGALSVFMLGAFAWALQRLPLAEAYALFFVAPLFVTALAVPLLGERVGWRRWSAIAVGFAGVIVVLRPSAAGMWSPAGLAVVAAAFAYALSAIAVRVLGRSDSTHAMVFWMLVMLSAMALALAWPQWQPVRGSDWGIIAVLGTAGAAGQYAVTEAFRISPASRVAPFEYTALGWGIGLDWLIWNSLPDAAMLAGASIIALSGIYLLRRERVHAVSLEP